MAGKNVDADVSMLGESKARIINYLGEGEKSGGELSSMLSINQTAVREHAETLERMGIVQARFIRSGVGRPKKKYSLTPFGVELLPKHYDVLLNQLIKKIWDRGGDEMLSQLISDVVRELAANTSGDEALTLEQRVSRVVTFLNKMGFMATAEKSGDQLLVVRHNCIFNKTAKLYSGVLCGECDTALIKEPIGRKEIELVECIGKGDTSCKNLIKV